MTTSSLERLPRLNPLNPDPVKLVRLPRPQNIDDEVDVGDPDTAVTSGTIVAGATISGTGIASGTQIVSRERYKSGDVSLLIVASQLARV